MMQADTMQQLFDMLALNHSQSAGGQSNSSFSSSLIGGDSVNRSVLALSSAREWPRRKGGQSTGAGVGLTLMHMRFFKQLVKTDVKAAVAALRKPLAAACASTDRAHQVSPPSPYLPYPLSSSWLLLNPRCVLIVEPVERSE